MEMTMLVAIGVSLIVGMLLKDLLVKLKDKLLGKK